METVHWFISDPVSSITRPNKELKYFEKKVINPGETVYFTFEISPAEDLGFVNPQGKRFVESGTYYVIVKDQQVALELYD